MNTILPKEEWNEIQRSDDPKEYALKIFAAFIDYGRSNFTYDFRVKSDTYLLVDSTVWVCGSFAMALNRLFKYAGITL